MPLHNILFKPSVEKDLRKLPARVVQDIFKAVELLSGKPCTPPDIKLTGTERTWRHRVGSYRIIYERDHSTATIVIHHVRHRREVYRRL